MSATKKKSAKATKATKVTKAAKAAKATFLVGDIGGTRTRLAVYDERDRSPLVEAVFPSQEHASLEEIVERFLATSDVPPPTVAVFGVAGPVKKGVATITNLPWSMDERGLSRRLRVPSVTLVNDLVVGARGCLVAPPSSVVALSDGRPAKKELNIAVIAAGTGLGQARLVWADGRYLALPTEGGHRDFAPRDDLEVELLRFLWKRFPDHVSYERILSGDGLGTLYDFFVSQAPRGKREPRAIAARLAEGDRNAAIAKLGLAREHEPAARAVDLFASLYGAEAGNLALGELSLGGVFVVGNIGRHIVPARRELFMEGFLRKGRFGALLASMPVAVVTDPLVGLRGALAIAHDAVAP